MRVRNFSTIDYFNRIASKLQPKYVFSGKTKTDFELWKSQLAPELQRILGPFPAPVDLNPEVVWEIREEGLIKKKVLLDMEEQMSATALIYIPEKASTPLPAILCNHGHSRFGKDSVMGIISKNDPRRQEEIDCYNCDYGLQMAKHGFVTMAIDWRVFGERSDNSDPYMADTGYPYPGRDRCNVQFLRGVMMGINLLALNIFDAMRCVDYLTSLEMVDPNRIGTMGLSFGGTIAAWHSFLDPRIKAADIICYSACFDEFAVRQGKICGSQIVPGLYQLCDLADLQGLIAPKPLLAEIGLHDLCFKDDEALRCSRRVRQIFEAADASEFYHTDIFAGAHQFAGNKAFSFFEKYLKS